MPGVATVWGCVRGSSTSDSLRRSQLRRDQLPLGSQQRVLLLWDLEQQLTFQSLNFENELNNAASSFWCQMSGDVCEGRHLSSVNWSGNLRVTLLSVTSCWCVFMTTKQPGERISFMLVFPPSSRELRQELEGRNKAETTEDTALWCAPSDLFRDCLQPRSCQCFLQRSRILLM